ncbi:hypothetical protein AMTR_s00049p00211790 [Amborella trichopoda]|uniref:Reverse transcriptase zinc-binding domain-containing protein n=1 Tax=Amborella trichopoda TaxID=13333 RepID=W1Q017_AMBTC|nr:hypothetical protein AMTR_s00049p00211790 [Amborella trichopoda]
MDYPSTNSDKPKPRAYLDGEIAAHGTVQAPLPEVDVGKGDHTLFWFDKWLGDLALQDYFPVIQEGLKFFLSWVPIAYESVT